MTALEVVWGASEWAEVGSSAYLRGYVAEVWLSEVWGWMWKVGATSEVSEWPEAWASGGAKTQAGAKRSAAAALRRAARQAPATNPNTGEQNAWAR